MLRTATARAGSAKAAAATATARHPRSLIALHQLRTNSTSSTARALPWSIRAASAASRLAAFFKRPLASSLASTSTNGSSRTNVPPSAPASSATWMQTMAQAETLVVPPGGQLVNPMELIGTELGSLTDNIKKLLTTDQQLLHRLARYYFDQNGKHIRPLIILLVSQAASYASPPGTRPLPPSVIPHGSAPAPSDSFAAFTYIDTPISPALVGHEDDALVASFGGPAAYAAHPASRILPTQRRLAEITEMIHTASLLHDDVIDVADTRRGVPSVNAEHGNKLAILAGDYLLARASIGLARLRHCEVVELLASVIANLVEGEVMQLRNGNAGGATEPRMLLSASTQVPTPAIPSFDHYLEKTYMKTASLIAKSCRAATVLAGSPEPVNDVAYTYGKHLGLAFQLVDDLLDFTGSAVTFGKPAGGADLKLGLATAPVLFAAEEFPELRPLIARRFSEEGDAMRAFDLVHASTGLQKTRDLAAQHCQVAAQAIAAWPASPARDALIQLTDKVLTRSR
ncbi:coq1 putative hexaprenyl diphosphate synthase [Allomyces javanicus]|nr:coq1 putative hexaprenyl diphosphate synthase [Allomyces javanicus]